MSLPSLTVKRYIGCAANLIGKLSVEGYPDPAVQIAFIRLPKVASPHYWSGTNAVHIKHELFESFVAGAIVLQQAELS